jgi:hypothetical protein
VHGWIHQVRLLARDVKDRDVLRKLLTEVAPRANRPGGYTHRPRLEEPGGRQRPRPSYEPVTGPSRRSPPRAGRPPRRAPAE